VNDRSQGVTDSARCANCRKALSPSLALTAGKLCDKCSWAASAREFSDDAPTRPRSIIVPPAAL
jgi:hypothetical protein